MLRFSFVTFLLFTLSISSAQAQFKTKKTRLKGIKSFLFHNPVEIGEIKFNTRIKAGFGLPQGVMGINGEFGLDYISITAGIGYGKMRETDGTLGFHVGLRGYVLNNERKIRPRISTHYGLSNIYNENNKSTNAYGPTIGVGFEHKITDIIVYDLEYTFRINPLNTYRPSNLSLESYAFPQIGVGVYF